MNAVSFVLPGLKAWTRGRGRGLLIEKEEATDEGGGESKESAGMKPPGAGGGEDMAFVK